MVLVLPTSLQFAETLSNVLLVGTLCLFLETKYWYLWQYFLSMTKSWVRTINLFFLFWLFSEPCPQDVSLFACYCLLNCWLVAFGLIMWRLLVNWFCNAMLLMFWNLSSIITTFFSSSHPSGEALRAQISDILVHHMLVAIS